MKLVTDQSILDQLNGVNTKTPVTDPAILDQLNNPQTTYDPLEGVGSAGKFFIGVGSGMTDMYQGIGQLFGLISQEEIQEKQAIDASGGLNESGWATAGNVTGKLALAAPAMFVPGANTATGALLVGGGIGLTEPVAEGDVLKGKAINTAIGAGLGRAGHEIGKYGGQYIVDKLKARALQRATEKSQNIVKDSTLKAGMDLGYKVNPTQANPVMANQILEGAAGKITTAQKVAEGNQQVTNIISRRALGLSDDAPLTTEALDQVRALHGEAYKNITKIETVFTADSKYADDLLKITKPNRAISKDFPVLVKGDLDAFAESMAKTEFSPAGAIEAIKQLRIDAKVLFKSDDPGKRALAKGTKSAADALERLVGRNLKSMGNPELLAEFQAARKMIAKTYTIEGALNTGSGNVVSRKLGRALDKGVPLTGELKDAAKFANTFPKATQEITSSMPGVSPLDYAATGIAASAAGRPTILGAMMGRPLVRNLITSKPYQKVMSQPKYRNHAELIRAMQSKRIPSGLSVAAPSVYLGQQ